MSRTTKELFIETYNAIETVVAYDHDTMANGTDYFDGLVDLELELPVGSRFKIHTGEGNNRRIVGIVTPVGNAVFFERYSGGEGPIIAQGGHQFLGLISTGPIDIDHFDRLVGTPKDYNPNIGKVLRNVILRSISNALGRKETGVQDSIVSIGGKQYSITPVVAPASDDDLSN